MSLAYYAGYRCRLELNGVEVYSIQANLGGIHVIAAALRDALPKKDITVQGNSHYDKDEWLDIATVDPLGTLEEINPVRYRR